MKICHVITRLIVGGAQENTVSTCIGLRKLGHDVDLVIGPQTGPEGSLYDQAKAAGVPIIIVDELRRAPNPWLDVSACLALRRLFVAKRYDVVHTHSGKAGLTGRFAAKMARVPIIAHTIHGPSFYKLSEPGRQLGVSMGGAGSGRLHDAICVGGGRNDGAIPRGGYWQPGQIRHDPQRDEHRCVFERVTRHFASQIAGDFGRAIWWWARSRGCFGSRGHEFLFEAAPRIVAAVPNVKFLLVGDGIYRERFERQAAQMNLRKHYVFAGLVPPQEIPRYVGVDGFAGAPVIAGRVAAGVATSAGVREAGGGIRRRWRSRSVY